jgi:hypothetical protein
MYFFIMFKTIMLLLFFLLKLYVSLIDIDINIVDNVNDDIIVAGYPKKNCLYFHCGNIKFLHDL